MEKELFSKEWRSNTAREAEVIIMLDIIITIYKKSRDMQNRRLKAFINNRELGKIVNSSMKIANHYNQDRATEIIAIKRLIDKYTVVINVDRIYVHKEMRGTFQ